MVPVVSLHAQLGDAYTLAFILIPDRVRWAEFWFADALAKVPIVVKAGEAAHRETIALACFGVPDHV